MNSPGGEHSGRLLRRRSLSRASRLTADLAPSSAQDRGQRFLCGRASRPSMQRFSRAHLLGIWCCAFLAAFAYVLFDQLDIDGSNFDRTPGIRTVAEEQLGGEDAARHIAPGHGTPWLPPPRHLWATGRSAPAPAPRISRACLSHHQPRAMLFPRGTLSSQPGSDPARPSAAA
jgi:hypothetical protein